MAAEKYIRLEYNVSQREFRYSDISDRKTDGWHPLILKISTAAAGIFTGHASPLFDLDYHYTIEEIREFFVAWLYDYQILNSRLFLAAYDHYQLAYDPAKGTFLTSQVGEVLTQPWEIVANRAHVDSIIAITHSFYRTFPDPAIFPTSTQNVRDNFVSLIKEADQIEDKLNEDSDL